MAALHDAELERPAPILSIAQLSQWKIDHEISDRRQFDSIDRKLNWLIGLLLTAVLAVAGTLANDRLHEDDARLRALEHAQPPASMPPARP